MNKIQSYTKLFFIFVLIFTIGCRPLTASEATLQMELSNIHSLYKPVSEASQNFVKNEFTQSTNLVNVLLETVYYDNGDVCFLYSATKVNGKQITHEERYNLVPVVSVQDELNNQYQYYSHYFLHRDKTLAGTHCYRSQSDHIPTQIHITVGEIVDETEQVTFLVEL